MCGPAGSGKTHLLQAACVRLSERGRAAAYVPLVRCAALGPGLLSGYEHLEAVFLDDLDTVAGDAAWESALFTLHNELQEHGGRMVATARMPPAKLPWGLPDLASRLAAASVHTLRPLPESEQGAALLASAATLLAAMPASPGARQEKIGSSRRTAPASPPIIRH